MTKRAEREWLTDIIAWGERLQRHLSGVDRDHFFGSETLQDAATKCIEAVGEAAGKLDDLDPELDKTIPDLNLKLARKNEGPHFARLLQRRPGHRVGDCGHCGPQDRGGSQIAPAEVRRRR